jgi:serine/threonine protein kinase
MSLPDHILDHLSEVLVAPDLSGSRYELLEKIGAGGMSTVYRARDRVLDRPVALKVIEAVPQQPASALEEARLLASLEHPGIVTVYDAGLLPDQRIFCALQLVEGVPLHQFIAGGPGLAQRLGVFKKLCEAVAFAHSRGVIHRDLKPANVMVGIFGRVIVLDWGIALRAETPADAQHSIAGTWPYMAPEQRRAGPVTESADIYALGVLLAEILPDRAPKPLPAIAAKASAPTPEQRYARVEDLIWDINRFEEHLPVTAHRASLWEAMARFAVRNRVLLLLVLAYVLVRIVLIFVHLR